MIDKARSLFELIRSGLISFRDTDPSQVQFGSLGLALGAGLFLLSVLIFKLLWGRNKSRRSYSGHRIAKEDQRGNTTKYLNLFPKFIFAGSLFFLLLSLANPYLPRTKIEEKVESRERVDLLDVSPSMGWEFGNTGKATGQIIREAFLNFLRMRNGQNDRASLWYFSSEPYMVEDFIIDDEIYLMEAEDAPYIVIDPGNNFLPENDPQNQLLDIISPKDKIKKVFNGGGTNLVAALDAVVRHFDSRGSRKIKQRALLIETDMAVDENPEKQLRELRKRNISIYLLYIKPNEIGEMQGNGGKKILNAQLFRKQLEQSGVKFYDIQDRRSFENAYRDINKLEKSPTSLIRHLLRILIYQRPLIVGTILLFFAIGLGLVTEQFFGENP